MQFYCIKFYNYLNNLIPFKEGKMADLKLDVNQLETTFHVGDSGWLAAKFVSGDAISIIFKKTGDNSVARLTKNNAIYINGKDITLSIENEETIANLKVHYWGGDAWHEVMQW